MSHVIVPEVTIDPTPLMLELCSDNFDLESLELNLEAIESAAMMIREACHASASAINTSKTNLLLAYMAEPKCRRWVKTEFLDRVDCDNGLLTKVARLCKFRFYTAEKLVIEDLDNNGEFTPNESVAARTGVPEKTVVRVKKKIEKKKVEAEEKRAQALQESLEADKVDLPDVEMSVLNVTLPVDSPSESLQDSANDENESLVSQVQIESVQVNQHESAIADEASVKEIETSSEALSPRELAFRKEIEQLQLMLAERDAEIANLKALV
ncbi:hypothetical protein PQO03_06190 [Lentisphaera profundi]|uniref:Uncharacterized protein n=1 Tax=Lentisphaera profundi TaxID=1658616 RepID=A0ABY7VT49_9BACT|nr:hypothetical protein [Lentisphaera profundi]WDE95308.1 hypothetical protein PQO03_06190 [Lentisphaera profundi]